jgi:hypothetical protein
LRVHVRLLQMLLVQQPKLLLAARLVGPKNMAQGIELVWDPLTEGLEAPACPECGRPTFELEWRGRVVCPACAARPQAPRRR